jgi:hypothetical protein
VYDDKDEKMYDNENGSEERYKKSAIQNQLSATTCPGEVLTKTEAFEAKAGTLNSEPSARSANPEP